MTGLKKTVQGEARRGELCKLKVSEHEASAEVQMLAASDVTGQREEA